jgi:thiol-disulfide isomerase/thioredoxin
MLNGRHHLCLILMIAGGIVGCAPSNSSKPSLPPTSSSVDQSTTASTQAASPTVLSDKVRLVEMDFDQFQEFVNSKKGQVVVVDMWATWCPPCVKGFPNLVALRKKHPEKDVACISLSLDHQGIDPIADVAQSVREFLEKQQANLDNILSTEESDAILKKFGIASIPVVDVYDRDGKLARRFDESSGKHFDYAEVDKLVEQLANAQ